jgi:hypothetical protein
MSPLDHRAMKTVSMPRRDDAADPSPKPNFAHDSHRHAGRVPGISGASGAAMDGRVKPGHDEGYPWVVLDFV